MKNKGAKQKLKRKGAASAFGCDLTEYLESSGQDVPYVLKSCAEFIETHGIVDGIYRLSGVTSNIQKLRQEFVSDQCPDLTREVYLQDIHCVGSLCKLYFRELPNPLLTYELYKKFTEAVSRFPEDEQLARIQNVIQELPPSHYRTLEYLIKHLTHLASFSNMTNMHTRNLALVWAPNLLRSKEIEAVGCNGDAAFLEVRVQQLVIEFILNHVDQIFNNNRKASSAENIESASVLKSLTLPSASLPMKLVSLEEAQARSLSASHPARKERRENSLPEIVPVTGSLFHTVVDLPDSKRKLSTKSKKWKSIFNLGRSGSESKSKLSRNGSVFVRAQKLSEKATIRPAKSMDSLCSLPVEGEDEKSRFKRAVTTGGFFVPVMKLRTGGTGSSYDLSKENEWEREGSATGSKGSSEPGGEKGPPRTPQAKSPPEQLKVFRPGEDAENEQTSSKGGRMFYTSETAKSGFPSSLFPLEASPRHQRKALNISEPFAVSVPLRVSAVISTNSTPCRVPAKEKLSLSSLEELSSLVSESTSPSSLEAGTHTRTEQAPERKEKQPGPTPPAAASRGSHPEELVAARKSESLETPQPAVENQEALCRQSSCTSSTSRPWQSSEQSPILEQRPASEVHTGPILTDKAEKVQLKMKDISSESSCGQQEIKTTRREEGSRLRDVTQEDPTNTLLEPLWPEIQQELKIIEPEEEFLLPKRGLISESSSSLQTDSSSSDRGQSPTLSEQKSTSRTPQMTTQVPLFCATGMEQQDSLHSCQSDVVAQQSCTSALPKLGTLPTGTATPKNHHPVVDSRSECLTPPLNWKLHSQSEFNEVAPSDEFSCSKGACPELGREKDSTFQPQKEKDGLTRVQTQKGKPEVMTADERDTFSSKVLSGAGIQELKEGNAVSRTHDAGDQEDEDTWTDNVQSLELVEPWEDHQWVTSPLHSPTFKDVQEKMIQEFQPQNQRAETGLSLRPRFSRSLSLDSKDKVMSLWTIPFPFIDATDHQQPCNDILPVTCELPKTQPISPSSLGKAKQDDNGINPREEPSKLEELRYPLSRDEAPAEKEGPSRIPFPEEKKVDVSKENPWSSKLELSLLYQNSPGSSSKVKNTKEELSMSQDTALGGETVTKASRSATEAQLSNKSEETPRKVKTRPSSLNLDSLLPAPDFFTFESLSIPSAPGNLLCGQKEVKSSDSVPSLPTACPAASKGIPWGSRFNAHVDLDLDYLAVAHATTGRRNSAPVSVSAVRTSFMIKMCQARAVPVIPPKIQYTQIPQPLQAQNAAPPAEKKEAEAKQAIRQTQRGAWSHLEAPKSPLTEKKAKAEKENSDPAQKDSACPWHSGLGSPLEQPQSSHYPALDAPVLRRKRTSEGETAGDNPQSSKMERPSGFSKPSYRSRPGRPQSLILFSPPFPIMDHPSSSADSRVLLSPIRSPTQTTPLSPICGDLSETSRTTPEGVTLRNKMTIPKNGQRLETSTSCFYQPQRRSVILDGRSGRQID
ncbi:rho GTPase-activating protein 31 [Caloenas nicobarica]|uniref:rho GTPase-activating protein 31 n=1 Tax=Caloenas nicobarica TaxID=187106 RepID=UPI0032B859E7